MAAATRNPCETSPARSLDVLSPSHHAGLRYFHLRLLATWFGYAASLHHGHRLATCARIITRASRRKIGVLLVVEHVAISWHPSTLLLLQQSMHVTFGSSSSSDGGAGVSSWVKIVVVSERMHASPKSSTRVKVVTHLPSACRRRGVVVTRSSRRTGIPSSEVHRPPRIAAAQRALVLFSAKQQQQHGRKLADTSGARVCVSSAHAYSPWIQSVRSRSECFLAHCTRLSRRHQSPSGILTTMQSLVWSHALSRVTSSSSQQTQTRTWAVAATTPPPPPIMRSVPMASRISTHLDAASDPSSRHMVSPP